MWYGGQWPLLLQIKFEFPFANEQGLKFTHLEKNFPIALNSLAEAFKQTIPTSDVKILEMLMQAEAQVRSNPYLKKDSVFAVKSVSNV